MNRKSQYITSEIIPLHSLFCADAILFALSSCSSESGKLEIKPERNEQINALIRIVLKLLDSKI